MKILITGCNGQLGNDCTEVLRFRYEVVACNRQELDIADEKDVRGALRKYKPDIIVNCAAYTKVDACETERELAWKINVDGVRRIASGASDYGSKLIHISTDYVFNGKKNLPEPYSEEDETCPLSYYGKTKLEGEKSVREIVSNHMIIRTAWLYGMNGQNFLKTMLKFALHESERQVTVVNDQYGNPTWTYQLAMQISKLIELDGQGTFHATSEGYCTWYDLAKYFLEKLGVRHNLKPCSTDEFPTQAVRPLNSILENKRLKELSGHLMTHWQDGVDRFAERFRKILIS